MICSSRTKTIEMPRVESPWKDVGHGMPPEAAHAAQQLVDHMMENIKVLARALPDGQFIVHERGGTLQITVNRGNIKLDFRT